MISRIFLLSDPMHCKVTKAAAVVCDWQNELHVRQIFILKTQRRYIHVSGLCMVWVVHPQETLLRCQFSFVLRVYHMIAY
jgi:hypothetical protein